ncbi:hypothetical protein N9242_04520 [Vicingaceae bacterium]|nr:hypothetical protein [Vicingaceae bacterium]
MKKLIILPLIFIAFIGKGQFVHEKPEVKDTAFTIPMITLSYAYQWVGGDLSDRFGPNSNVGGSFMVKSKRNWIWGVKGNFIWGGSVKEDNILDDLLTSSDEIIDNNGQLTAVHFGERGSSFFAFGGRMINKLAPNKNSGFIFYGGLGMLQHKISLKFQDDIVVLSDQHKKGYDRFSLGFAANGFAGYMFLSKNRLLNFFGGIDYTFGWTKSLRKYNYDTRLPDTETQTNSLYGIRVGWIIRLNKRKNQEYYYH